MVAAFFGGCLALGLRAKGSGLYKASYRVVAAGGIWELSGLRDSQVGKARRIS